MRRRRGRGSIWAVLEGIPRMKLEGRAAIVTGGNRGIGKAVALELAAQGADVAFNYRRDEESARETAAEIEGAGAPGSGPSKRTSRTTRRWKRWYRRLKRRSGQWTYWCATRGSLPGGTTWERLSRREMRRVLDVHLFGALHFARAVLPGMREKKSGRRALHIVDVAVQGGVGTRALRHGEGVPGGIGDVHGERRKRQHGIRVNVIAPGLVETEMGKRLVKATQGVEDIKEIYPDYPFGRVCQPEDIAKLSAFLASEDGGYISGHVIHLDGGMAR